MKFDINEDLDIILITYNRVDKLKEIVSDILDENSPIKSCKITFLDNCSTDGTSEFLIKLSEEYSNIIHIRHKVNIGGNANIVRAFEYVTKKYFWILCDDDRLDFTYWENVEIALKSDKYDIIETYTDPKVFSGETYTERLSKLLIEIVLLPAAIYRSKYLKEDVIFNAYINIYALIPHMALISQIINNNGKVYFCEGYDKQIVLQGISEANYKKGVKKSVHPFVKGMDLSIGFILSLCMIKDKELKYKCIDRIRSYLGITFSGFIAEMPYYWIKIGLKDNIMPIYDACNDIQKKAFLERLMEISYEFKKINRNTLNTFNFHIFNFHKIRKRFFSISFIGFTYTRNREYPKLCSLFGIIKDIYYLKIKLFFLINLKIKLYK
ncbi:glycosyltransferase [Brachyspira murdochii]|uniref:glycosyltransferase family 2 protein n=1 Tax=Brachyspira murdochii TaxID=84378 RepID=UPI003003F36A